MLINSSQCQTLLDVLEGFYGRNGWQLASPKDERKFVDALGQEYRKFQAKAETAHRAATGPPPNPAESGSFGIGVLTYRPVQEENGISFRAVSDLYATPEPYDEDDLV